MFPFQNVCPPKNVQQKNHQLPPVDGGRATAAASGAPESKGEVEAHPAAVLSKQNGEPA